MSSMVLGTQWWAKIKLNCIFGWLVIVKYARPVSWLPTEGICYVVLWICSTTTQMSRRWRGLLGKRKCTWTKVQGTKCRQESEGACYSSIWDRKRICSWGLTTGQTMLSESKLGPLISFSWPLLKLKPQIFPGCYGLHGPLITVVRASLWREGKGWGFGSGGQLKQRWLPAANCSDAKENRQGCCKSWCVTVTGSINPVDLSLAGCVCSSLTEVLMGHCAVPGGTKLYSSVGGQSLKKNSLNMGFTVKYVAWNMNP